MTLKDLDVSGDLEQRLAQTMDCGPNAINDRIEQLKREWTVGRMTKAVAASLVLVGSALALWVHVWFAALAALGGILLLQYLLTPKSWLGDLMQIMGYRRKDEVEQERVALRVIRGDFRHLPTLAEAEDREAISRMEDEGGIVPETVEEKMDIRDAAKIVADQTKEEQPV